MIWFFGIFVLVVSAFIGGFLFGIWLEGLPAEDDMGADWVGMIGLYTNDPPPAGVSADLWFEFICAVELGFILPDASTLGAVMVAFNSYLHGRDIGIKPVKPVQMVNILRATGRVVETAPGGVENWIVVDAGGLSVKQSSNDDCRT